MKTIATPSPIFWSLGCTVASPSREHRTKRFLLIVTLAIGALCLDLEAAAQPGAVLNYVLKTAMANAGVDADAVGTVNSTLRRNSSGDSQRLKVVLAGLNPETSYQLNAFLRNDTSPTSVGQITTDRRGRLLKVYSKNRLGNAALGTELLPASIDPLCNVREVEVVDSGGQSVLRAVLPLATGRQYVVIRRLDNSGFNSAVGTLRIIGTTRSTLFRLVATGLNPDTDYILSVNGGAGQQTVTANSRGKVKVLTLPEGFASPLDIHSLALSDTEGNLLLSTGGIGLPCDLESTNPPDTTPPTVSSTDPANAATGVPINQNINATFSEAMDPSTITSDTVTLRQGATPVAGTVSYAGNTAIFTRASNLAPNTVYTATVTTGARDLAGNALANDVVWSFTTGATSDTTPPTVSSTDPANAASGVPLNQNVRAVFSEAMDASTITTGTMRLRQGVTPVAGSVTYAGNTATFAPANNLAPGTVYTATITTGAKDPAGNALANDVVWSFTTGTPADTTPPTVSSTEPTGSATGVSVSQAIRATFSEPMNPATLTTTTMTLRRGATPVAGTVTYAGNTATFTPANNLDANTVYTARITTGATDAAGNALANNFTWSFTTASSPTPQTPVALGSAAGFAVLAGSTVTSTSFTVINNGDVGVSPGTAVEGFPPAAINNGTIHAADTSAVQAKVDLTAAYNDAAGRTVGAVTIAGNLGGQTLTPGLYKSTSSLEISSGDLTLDAQGDANAVFIFQIASTLTTTVDRKIILTGNARAANVFWQVGSSATLGAISVFKGTLMADQSITLATGAMLEGRALARSGAVTLDAATVTIPAP
jgi:hypothetical protein